MKRALISVYDKTEIVEVEESKMTKTFFLCILFCSLEMATSVLVKSQQLASTVSKRSVVFLHNLS